MARAMQAFENRSRRRVFLSEGIVRARHRRQYDLLDFMFCSLALTCKTQYLICEMASCW